MHGAAIKKPIVVYYFKIEQHHPEALREWIKILGHNPDDIMFYNVVDNRQYIKTLEGHSYPLEIGMYVLSSSISGEYWPIQGHIFDDTYEIQPV